MNNVINHSLSEPMTRDYDIITGIATAFHANNWADRYKENGGNLSGCEILEVMDPVTEYAKTEALTLYKKIESLNNVNLEAYFENEIEAKQELTESDHLNNGELFG